MEWFVSPMRCTWRRLLFTRKWLWTGVSFQVKDRGVCPLLSSRTPFGAHPCRHCACCHSLYEFMCVPALLCLKSPCFLAVLHSLQLTLFLPAFPVSLSSEGRLEHPFRSLTLPIVCLWISVYVFTCLRRWLLWWLSKTLAYEYRMSLGVFYS